MLVLVIMKTADQSKIFISTITLKYSNLKTKAIFTPISKFRIGKKLEKEEMDSCLSWGH